MIELLFALVTLGIWSNSDIKTGKVHNIALVLPVVISAVFFFTRFVYTFIPIFAVLVSIWLIMRKKGLFGFADVIGIPFTLLFVTGLQLIAILSFMGVFGYLTIYASRGHKDKKLKRRIYDRVLLMPILFLAFFVGVLVHLITAWLF